MKKVIVQMSISLDGYYEGPEGQLDWHVVDDDFNDYSISMLDSTEVLIMGRKTYELMAAYWPDSEDDSGVKERINGLPKLVFSNTLKTVAWQNSHLATKSIEEELDHLKSMPGGGLIPVGGGELATAFLQRGLIDELRLIVTPILLGGGEALFGGITNRSSLKLKTVKPFKSGSVVLVYEPKSSG